MGSAIRWGMQLAWRTDWSARRRTAAIALTAALGSLFLLTVADIARTVIWMAPVVADTRTMGVALAAAVSALTVPIVTAMTVVTRLSWGLRERRLAVLRVLGLDPARTRGVAVGEIGVHVFFGVASAMVVFPAMRPGVHKAVSALGIPHIAWQPATALDHALVAVLVIGTAIAAGVPWRSGSAYAAMNVVRRSQAARGGWWRPLPLLVGLVACVVARQRVAAVTAMGAKAPGDAADVIAVYLLVAILGCSVGLVAVMPWLVRLGADLLVRQQRSVALVLSGRRLQARPATTARIIAGLMLALFLGLVVRALIAGFEATPEYRRVDHDLHQGQRLTVHVEPDRADAVIHEWRSRTDVTAVIPLGRAIASCRSGDSKNDGCAGRALVMTCTDLRHLVPEDPRCHEGHAYRLVTSTAKSQPPRAEGTLTLTPDGASPADPTTPHAVVSIPAETLTLPDMSGLGAPIHADYLIPPGSPGMDRVVQDTSPRQFAVLGVPGRSLLEDTRRAGISDDAIDLTTYDDTHRMRAALAAVLLTVLAVGLLVLAIATGDHMRERRGAERALSRLGVPARLRRRAHLVEIGSPLLLGILLACLTGRYVGGTIVAWGHAVDSSFAQMTLPWTDTLLLGGAALIGGAALTSLVAAMAAVRGPVAVPRTE
ncbi:hypothetical protein KEM60_02818 [Austwickia sp. TVS 96-490-7B]|uniref:hypothetical protein n=1 Tax=Austwickia sp. TVS 96-490-7B TaxID=2830843 RepID=UPI001C592716|nr:hypothetical protein [Austwickia sp. TVS 96-490-7B]MBW3086590.1 hypothetical protein [Austwickia sp. TVS 96-490-7B]